MLCGAGRGRELTADERQDLHDEDKVDSSFRSSGEQAKRRWLLCEAGGEGKCLIPQFWGTGTESLRRGEEGMGALLCEAGREGKGDVSFPSSGEQAQRRGCTKERGPDGSARPEGKGEKIALRGGRGD